MSIFYQYILVVVATDRHGNNADPPMEIVITVEDVNDNPPQCEHEESIFEVQEQEPIGKLCVCVCVLHYRSTHHCVFLFFL